MAAIIPALFYIVALACALAECQLRRGPRPRRRPHRLPPHSAPTAKMTLASDVWLQSPGIVVVTPLGRLATAPEIAHAILYLARPASAMVTGHTLAVDGGFLAQ